MAHQLTKYILGMKKTFWPAKDAALLIWATNYKDKIGLYATALGMTPAEEAEDLANCDEIIAAIVKANSQRTLLRGANDAKKIVYDTDGLRLRTAIARFKKAPLYTTAIGKELDVVGMEWEFNPNEYKPDLLLNTSGVEVQIRFKKRGVQGINIYKRKKGIEAWELLSRATKSPFEFRPALENVNRPEQWEFRAFGVIKDKEIGLTSDISEILIGD